MVPDYCPEDGAAVTTSDVANSNNGYGFMVGVAGNVVLRTLRGTILTLTACQPGIQYAFKFTEIRTASTATGIIRFTA